MRAATSTMTAWLIAEWMSFVGRLHTAVRRDGGARARCPGAEDLADEAGDGTIAATAANSRGPGPLAAPPAWRNTRISSRIGHPGSRPHTAHLRPAANRAGIPTDQQDAK